MFRESAQTLRRSRQRQLLDAGPIGRRCIHWRLNGEIASKVDSRLTITYCRVQTLFCRTNVPHGLSTIWQFVLPTPSCRRRRRQFTSRTIGDSDVQSIWIWRLQSKSSSRYATKIKSAIAVRLATEFRYGKTHGPSSVTTRCRCQCPPTTSKFRRIIPKTSVSTAVASTSCGCRSDTYATSQPANGHVVVAIAAVASTNVQTGYSCFAT